MSISQNSILPWYENSEERKYRGITYTMYKVTPQKAEQKIRAFIDQLYSEYRIGRGDEDRVYIGDIITEGSETVLFDVWFIDIDFITQNDISPQKKPSFIISRGKCSEKKRRGMRIRYVL